MTTPRVFSYASVVASSSKHSSLVGQSSAQASPHVSVSEAKSLLTSTPLADASEHVPASPSNPSHPDGSLGVATLSKIDQSRSGPSTVVVLDSGTGIDSIYIKFGGHASFLLVHLYLF